MKGTLPKRGLHSFHPRLTEIKAILPPAIRMPSSILMEVVMNFADDWFLYLVIVSVLMFMAVLGFAEISDALDRAKHRSE